MKGIVFTLLIGCMSGKIAHNGLQIPEGGDYEAQNFKKNKCLIEAKMFL